MKKSTEDGAGSISLLFPSMLPENLKTLLNRKDLLYSIRHDKVIIYKGIHSAYHGKKRSSISDLNLKKRKYNGSLSKEAVKHVSKQVTLWADSIENYNRYYSKPLNMRKRQMTFFTITLPAPQFHTDQEIKRKVFVPFLDSMKYHHNTDHYFWRAEAQKNNNIHFHIIFDKYIKVQEVARLWNQCLEKLGYITEFEKKFNHRNPPTTHAKIVDNQKYTIKYLLKYATKASDARNITGKIWGMSDSIRSLKVPSFLCTPDVIFQMIKDLSKSDCKLHHTDHYATFTFPNPIFKRHTNNISGKIYSDHLFKIYSFLYFEDCPFDSDPAMLIYEGLDTQELSSISRSITPPDKNTLELWFS